MVAAVTDLPLGLPVGVLAPDFRLPDVHGETVTLASLRAPGKSVVLTFIDPLCGQRLELLPDLGRWQRAQAARLTIAVVNFGPTRG